MPPNDLPLQRRRSRLSTHSEPPRVQGRIEAASPDLASELGILVGRWLVDRAQEGDRKKGPQAHTSG
jgi:hypothetical protein